MSDRRALLLVLDGAGFRTDTKGNAVTERTLPSLFATMRDQGFAVLEAAGTAVGLEDGQVGNSEAGHLTIGAGEVVPSTVRRLLLAYEDGSWGRDPQIARLAAHASVHVLGLLSDAGVHALARTIVHAATLLQQSGCKEIVVHPVLDGVDSPAGSGVRLLRELRAALACLPAVRI
ncbi:MAG: 2,3-bisphosphoglycerate-independent phosphoglycerate mutase, partial [Planctomycetota bacterium]